MRSASARCRMGSSIWEKTVMFGTALCGGRRARGGLITSLAWSRARAWRIRGCCQRLRACFMRRWFEKRRRRGEGGGSLLVYIVDRILCDDF